MLRTTEGEEVVWTVLVPSLVETRHCFGLVPELRGAVDRQLFRATHTTDAMQSGISGACLANSVA